MVGEGVASSSSAVPGVQAASSSLPLQFYQGMLQYPVTIASVLPPQFAVPATVAPSSSPFSEAAQIFGASCVQPPRVTGAAGGPISGACGHSLSKGAPLGLGCNYAGGATTTTPSSGVVFRPPPASNWASGLGPPLPPPPGAAVVGPNIDAPASALAVRSTLSAWQHAQRRVYPDALLQHVFQHQGDAIKVHAMEDSLVGDIKPLGEQGYLMSGHPGLGCSVSDSAVLDIAAPVEQQTSERENVEVVNQQFDLEERIVASEHDVPSGHTGWEDADGENCGDLTGLLKALSEEPGSPICLDSHDVDMCDQPPELSMGQPSEQLCEQPFEQPCEASVLHTKVSDRKASPGPHNYICEGVLGLEWTKVETGMSKGKGEANVKEEEGVRDDKIEEGEFVLSSITASGGFQHPDPMPFSQIPQNIQEAGLYSRPTQAMRSDMRPTLGVNKDSHHGKKRSHLAVLRKQFKESLQGFRISAGSLKAMGIAVTSAQERCSLQMVPQSAMGASGLPIASRPSCVGTKGPTDGGLPVDRNPSVKGIQIPTYMEHSVQVVPIKTEYNGKPCLPGVMVFRFGGAKVMTENVSFKKLLPHNCVF
ncbi:hypothetical protein CY35_03G044700 [Sphagnum magellanicum]|nr:hypothetical protein CY35_03G044700 [Sphagnum magellanicum]